MSTGVFSLDAESITDLEIAPNASIQRSKLAQRSNGRLPILQNDWRVWDALSQALPGEGALEAGVFAATFNYTPATLTTPFFVAGRAYRVLGITGREEVAGTGGACTAVIRKAASATALTAGTALHTGSYNLVGSASTNQVLALSATPADLDIPSGTCIGFHLTGTPTSATGEISVLLAPAPSIDDLRLVTGTWGVDPGPYVGTPDVKATSGTRRAVCFLAVPPDYESTQSLTLRLFAGMLTTVADTSCTIDVEAWRIDRDATLGAADLIDPASVALTMNSLVASAKDFNVLPTTLAAGDVIAVRVSIAYVDAATVAAVIAAVWQAELLADLR